MQNQQNVKFSLKIKIFAVVLFIQTVVISVFIYLFVQSFKQDKLISAYELNANSIFQLKNNIDAHVAGVMGNFKAATDVIEQNNLDASKLLDHLNLTQNKNIGALFHYEFNPTIDKLNFIKKSDNLNLPDLNDYLSKIYSDHRENLPFFWSYESANKKYTGFAFSLSYVINYNGIEKQKKHVFFLFFDPTQLFQLKNTNQLSEIFIFTKSGQNVYSQNEMTASDLTQVYASLNLGEATNTVQTSSKLINGVQFLISSQNQNFGGLVISTRIPTKTAFAGVAKVYTDAFFLAAFSILFSYTIAYYLSSTITKPLQYLTTQMKKVSKGDLDMVVKVDSNDEIGVLANSFKQMTFDLKTSKSELVQLNLDLENKIAERTKQLEELTIKDPLTGAYNRRYFDRRLTEEITRAKRTSEKIGILYLDIDHFKKYNDQNGHPEGDQLLINFVQVVQSSTRTTDFFCRLGGEEFCIITTNTSLDGIAIFAEKIRSKIYSTDFKFGEKQPMGRLSCSIGLSLFPDFGLDPDSLVKSADEALYVAKQGGRNRWVLGSTSTSTPQKAS
jgi:diguanylate cyclase (GGDEF)-like protein